MKNILISIMVLLFPKFLAASQCRVVAQIYSYPVTCCLIPDDVIDFQVQFIYNTCPSFEYHFDFGDATTGTTSSSWVSHSYSTPGTYTITATPIGGPSDTILNPAGGSAVITTTITILSEEECSCGILDFTYSWSPCSSIQFQFNKNLVARDCDRSGVVYSWDFGDPTSGASNYSSDSDPIHVYADSGSYHVKLAVIIPANIYNPACTLVVERTINSSNGFLFLVPSVLTISSLTTSVNTPVTFQFNEAASDFSNIDLDFGDGNEISNWDLSAVQHSYSDTGLYTIEFTFSYIHCDVPLHFTYLIHVLSPPNLPCSDCIGSFNPENGKKYLISAWVSERDAGPFVATFANPSLQLIFTDEHHVATVLPDMYATGDVIDGWQRVEEIFTVPIDAAAIHIKMNCAAGHCLFDDIRVFPFDGTMKSYVYDPVSLKLVAELDERNYATLYEYDEDGKLIRVKKETERGIMTIKESRNHLSKK